MMHRLLERGSSVPRRWPRSLADRAALDPLASMMITKSRVLLRSPKLVSFAQGRWLGHPLHPALTDLPIGFWTSAFMVDLVGGAEGSSTAQRLIAWGNLTAVPTAIAGLADARELDHEDRRIAAVHAALNAGGLLAYVVSWSARAVVPNRKVAIASSVIGATMLTVAGHLGGHMVFESRAKKTLTF
jgi:uncharacterized membrane protein